MKFISLTILLTICAAQAFGDARFGAGVGVGIGVGFPGRGGGIHDFPGHPRRGINPQELIMAANEMARSVSDQAFRMDEFKKLQVAQKLQELKDILNGQVQPGPIEQFSTQLLNGMQTGRQTILVTLNKQTLLNSIQLRSLSAANMRIVDAFAIVNGRPGLGIVGLVGQDLLPFTPLRVSLVGAVDKLQLTVENNSYGAGLEVTLGSTAELPSFTLGQGSRGFYCVAACSQSNGAVSWSTARGAIGAFEIEAKQNARVAVSNSFNCTRGAVDVECSSVGDGFIKTTAMASCVKSDGSGNYANALVAKGSNVSEAKVEAAKAVVAGYNCTWGVTVLNTDSSYTPSYCSAACTMSDGRTPNLSNSRGAQGENQLEAQGNALLELRRSYNCTWGQVIAECSAR
jgi:hypothetical protein